MEAKTSRSLKYPHTVKLTWARNPNWNEICAWGIEHFGFPGDQYTTEVAEEYMCWNFASKYSQLLFVTAWGNDQ